MAMRRSARKHVIIVLVLASHTLVGCTGSETWAQRPAAPYGKKSPPELAMESQRPIENYLPNEDGDLARVIPTDVAFETGSAEIVGRFARQLRREARAIRRQYGGHVCIEGFADGVGAVRFNRTLSLARAKSVDMLFAAAGVSNDVTTVGHGETFARDHVDDPDQRRVEVTLGPCPTRETRDGGAKRL